MADELENAVLDTVQYNDGLFNVIVPQPFSLANQQQGDLDKILDEIMDKVKQWESRNNTFFRDYIKFADAWRVRPMNVQTKKPRGLFNSRSGETHRAAETLGTFWLRSLTARDPFFEAISEGFDDFGNEIRPEQLYSAESVIIKQLRMAHFKEKLLRSLRSIALFGTCIIEEPFISRLAGDGRTWFEYTDFVFRSLLKTGFDSSVMDIDMSDYIFTIDFYTKYALRRMSKADDEFWDQGRLEKYIQEFAGQRTSDDSPEKSTSVFDRLQESKQRAGYSGVDRNVFEKITYHGKLEVENPVIASLWESMGRQDDPNDYDFTVGVVNGKEIIQFHQTQFGTWHSRFKVAHFKLFEDEANGYGIGRIGRKPQREMDVTQSRANDILMFALYSMWKVSRFAGLQANQLNIKPWNIIELDDINGLQQIEPNINALTAAMGMIGANKEDFRTTVGAASNLQAQVTKASATEAALAQTEAVRGASVHAEIIAETFLREHIETCHRNNLAYLDSPVWIAATGENKSGFYDKNNLPHNIGVEIKIVLDKDFRPERLLRLREALDITTSIRNIVPEGLNAARPLFEEYFRALGMNPRLLFKPIPVDQQLRDQMNKLQQQGKFPQLLNEVQGEVAGEEAGGGAEQNVTQTPVGPVATSPASALVNV